MQNLNNSVIMCGDFNAHHTSWNCNRINATGKAIYNYEHCKNLEILLPPIPTRYRPNSATTIDRGTEKRNEIDRRTYGKASEIIPQKIYLVFHSPGFEIQCQFNHSMYISENEQLNIYDGNLWRRTKRLKYKRSEIPQLKNPGTNLPSHTDLEKAEIITDHLESQFTPKDFRAPNNEKTVEKPIESLEMKSAIQSSKRHNLLRLFAL
ncbi:hypothetical protein AVEN_72664-1 [Araneus ventricosus]|uniref:Endonuclease/exonuclease/phosphatase domain-containing protein n=1 Tax=Araneus ventricosus TaxID=182803 RepID=A0A4Y2L1X2_ARAVE|nr:hypothetical protein AVEN_72664-1 [Araneus ventricosus]